MGLIHVATGIVSHANQTEAKADKTYWVTASNKGFPHQRFEISLDETPAKMKEVEVKWIGHFLTGKKGHSICLEHTKI